MLVQITRSLKEAHKHIPDAILLIALMLFNNSKLKQRLLDRRGGKKPAKTEGEVA
jgi:hypothetical protein